MGELAGVCARAEDASRFWCGGLFRSWGVGRWCRDLAQSGACAVASAQRV